NGLFVRKAPAMVPTPRARGLIEPVRKALRGLEVTLNELEAFDPASTQKRFTVAVRDVFESTVLPSLLARVQRDAPSVDVAAVQIERRELESELASGALDA